MKLRTLFVLIVMAAISVFAALNWSAFTAPTTISLVFGVVQAPLGLIMLGLTAFLTVLFIIFAVFVQTSAFVEVHRHERELQAMRELAEHAEGSRFTKLHEFLEKETQRLADIDKESKTEVLVRLDKLEGVLNSAIDQSGNSLAAYIGELDDKLEKGARQTPGPSP
jgi:type III secretory pathway component EscR